MHRQLKYNSLYLPQGFLDHSRELALQNYVGNTQGLRRSPRPSHWKIKMSQFKHAHIFYANSREILTSLLGIAGEGKQFAVSHCRLPKRLVQQSTKASHRPDLELSRLKLAELGTTRVGTESEMMSHSSPKTLDWRTGWRCRHW